MTHAAVPRSASSLRSVVSIRTSHSTASCSLLRRSLLYSARLCRREAVVVVVGGVGDNKGKQMNKGGKKSMIYIKHNCCHFTFHQVWWLLCENGCPTFLVSWLFSPPFSPRSPLNQENNHARPSRFTVKASHVHLLTVVSSWSEYIYLLHL